MSLAQKNNLLTVQEAAEALALRKTTLRRWVLLRKIGYHKIGGAVRIPSTEVERIIHDGAVPAREVKQ